MNRIDIFRMSLSLLKRELEAASSQLLTPAEVKPRSKGDERRLKTGRHGVTKGSKKQKSEKSLKEKYSFKFSEEVKKNSTDRTKECLQKLAMLDSIAKNVSSTKIVDDTQRKKRQKRLDTEASERKEDNSSILLTEEEVAAIEKEYFINSKSKASKRNDIWND